MSSYAYIYIYIYIYIYGCMCVFVDGCPKKRSYLQQFWPMSDHLEGPFCLFWHEDHTKSCACVNLQDQKKRRRTLGELGVRLWSKVSHIQGPGHEARQSNPRQGPDSWGENAKPSSQEKKTRGSNVRNGMSSNEDDDQRWISIFDSC